MAVTIHQMTYAQAINEAMRLEMRRDLRVILMGEDVAGGATVTGFESEDAWGGVRPIAELMFVDFFGVCMDQIFDQGAKLRYMFGGKASCPLVIRTMIGAGMSAAGQHSGCHYSVFTDSSTWHFKRHSSFTRCCEKR